MKPSLTSVLPAVFAGLAFAVPAGAQPAPEPPPPVTRIVQPPAPLPPSEPAPAPTAVMPELISPDAARAIVARFAAAYERLGRPRLALVVNRPLVDESGGMRLTGRTEKFEESRVETTSTVPAPAAGTAAPPVQVVIGAGAGSAPAVVAGPGETKSVTERREGANIYAVGESPPFVLADQQTLREIGRLFGRPLRLAGAALVDPATVAALQPVGEAGDRAARERAALAGVADVVIEILVASREAVVRQVSGDRVREVPDIQATAVRLSDGRVLGQAASSDVLGPDRFAGAKLRRFDVTEITEATAFALMEDMASVGREGAAP